MSPETLKQAGWKTLPEESPNNGQLIDVFDVHTGYHATIKWPPVKKDLFTHWKPSKSTK